MRISNRTCAAFAVAVATLGHSSLSVFVLRYGRRADDPTAANLEQRGVAFAEALGCGRDRTEQEEQELKDAIENFLAESSEWSRENSEQIQALLRELEANGYSFRDDRLWPSTPAAGSPGPSVSKLESDLERHGLSIALNHFRQALDNFSRGNHEASGGSLGSFLENLLQEACVRLGGVTHDEPRAALDHLRNEGFLNDGQWNLLRGCWAGVQEGARHQGASDEELALLRLHIATAAGRYLVSLL